MLSDEEKEEMLEDAKNIKRQHDFRFAKKKDTIRKSFDEYLIFLNSVQKLFKPFPISSRSTPCKFNKL